MRKAVKFVLLLPVRIILLPMEVVLILITWIGIFVTSMSAWIFNLVATLVFALTLLGKLTGTITKAAISEVIFSGLMIPYANVALALNSKQWEHVFLESYRIIEHTFPVIFMKKLSKTGLTKSPMVVAKVLEEVISWRPPEEESLRLIFEEIIMRPEFQPIITFLSSSMSVAKEDLYRWYYKSVRNQIVHYRSIHIKLSFSDEQWDALIGLNFQIIKYLYKKYTRQIGAIDKTS